jgi:hypothetical protein
MPDARAELPDGAPGKVAVVVRAGLPIGQAANVAACIAAGLSAAAGGWAGRPLADADGLASAASSHLPIGVLMADDARLAVLVRAVRQGARAPTDAVVLFPAYAQAIQDAPTYWARHAATSHLEAPLLGIGLVGARKWVNSLVGSLPLLR